MNEDALQRVTSALDHFWIELPSWGFADTGTRFGKFRQEGSALDLRDKLADAGEVNKLTGCCPQVATRLLWDFAEGVTSFEIMALAKKNGVQSGPMNPNLFQDQEYRPGSLGNAEAAVRAQASQHLPKTRSSSWNTSPSSPPFTIPISPTGGCFYLYAKKRGPQAKVLVESGGSPQAVDTFNHFPLNPTLLLPIRCHLNQPTSAT